MPRALTQSETGQTPGSDEEISKPASSDSTDPAGDAREPAGGSEASATRAAGVNLLGQADTARGEGRRNENIQISLVDNNAQRDANQRIGATATITDEFRPERNYFSTEYGNASRGPVHVLPHAGSGFHGNFFWSHNNSIFSARAFFQVGPVQPARQNQYGAAFNVALWKGAFFSFNGSQDKNRGMVNGNVIILLPEERIPLATDPVVRAIVENLISAFPDVMPNRQDISARALNTNSPQSTNTDLGVGQLNQKVGSRDTVVLRYSFTGQQVKAFQFVRGQNPDTTNKSHGSRITWNRVWSPATVSDFSFGFDRQGTLLMPAEGAVGPVFFAGLTTLGPTTNIPLDRVQNQWLASYSIQQRQGRHALSAGAGFTRRQMNGAEAEGLRLIHEYRNNFGRDTIANLRMGTPSAIHQAIGDPYRAFRNWDFLAFAGDHWTVSNRLTLNFAARYEPITRPYDISNRTILPFDSDLNNLGGSFGFAYRLPGGFGILRGAAGVMFGQIFPATYGQARMNQPYYMRVVENAPDLANPFPGLDLTKVDPNARSLAIILSPDLATPYSYQYNFSWEAELHPGWRLQLGYVGSRSHKLFQNYILNRAGPVPGIPLSVETINDRRADPKTFENYLILNGSNAYYDAARATFTMANYHGLTLSSSYWFSKAIDLGGDFSNTSGGPDKFGQGGQTELGTHKDLRGLSNFHQPHSFLLQAGYDTGRRRSRLGSIYRNWNLSAVYLLKSGTPFGIDSGSDGPGFGNVDGSSADRVFVLDPSVLGQTVGNPDTAPLILARSKFRFMNAAAGEMAGNIGRNVFRKGKIANTNVSMSRTFILPHDWQMTLRAESINFTNTPQFAEPGRQLAAPNFAQITNTLNDGRTFRFTLRFAF